ncbi:MAG: hypothetical protein ABJI81_13710 [Bauldia litoralis]
MCECFRRRTQIEQKNLAVEALRKLLNGEIGNPDQNRLLHLGEELVGQDRDVRSVEAARGENVDDFGGSDRLIHKLTDGEVGSGRGAGRSAGPD